MTLLLVTNVIPIAQNRKERKERAGQTIFMLPRLIDMFPERGQDQLLLKGISVFSMASFQGST